MVVSPSVSGGDARQILLALLPALLTTIIVGAGLVPNSAAAQNETVVSIQSQGAEAGTSVDVPVGVTGLTQVGSVSLIVTYDPTVLSFPDDPGVDDLISNAVRENAFNASVPEPGELRISWFAGPGSDPIDLESGTLLEITFDEFAGETTEVAFESGSEISDADANVIGATFEDGTVSLPNQAPEVQGTIPDRTIETPGPPLQITGIAQTVFRDPDGDTLEISAASNDMSVVTAEVEDGGSVTLGSENQGIAEVTLTASDGQEEANLSFTVTVEERAAGDPEPSARALAVIDSSGDGDEFDFGDTGVKIVPAAVEGSGEVGVDLFGDRPEETGGILEENVSEYRVVITAPDGLGLGTDTEVRFPVSDFSGISDPTQVTIYKRPVPQSGLFTAVSTEVDDNGTPEDISDDELVGKTGDFSEFVLASDSNSLPVELVDFTALLNGKRATLRWQTATETNNAGFEVRHQGPSGDEFEPLGFVESNSASGTTQKSESYRFQTEELLPGNHRFRLRQVDLDGTETLVDTAAVSVQAGRTLALKSAGKNPVVQSTRVSFSVEKRGRVTVALYNTLGQEVKRLWEKPVEPEEAYTVEVKTSDLASGAYFVRLDGPGGRRTERIDVIR